MTRNRTSIEKVFQVLTAKKQMKSCVLVAIDGQGGAGKSTIAKNLAKKLEGQIVHNDDFCRVMDANERFELDAMGGAHNYFDWQRLQREVLEPLKNGKLAEYQKYDWEKNKLGLEATVQTSGIVIVEGVYSFRYELNQYYDLGIVIECP